MPVTRAYQAGASARGNSRAGARTWFSGEVQGAALTTNTFTTTQETPTITAMAEAPEALTTTLAIADLTPVAEPTEAPPTPTAAPPEVKTYAVQAGDNLFVISERFGISQDTVVWSNPDLEKYPDLLSIGQEITILPVDGVLHTVQKGDTLAAIAQRYNVDAQRITEYNLIVDPDALQLGQQLIVPGGVKPPEPKPAAKAQGGSGGGGSTVPATISGGRLMIPAGAGGESGAPAQPGRFAWPVRGMLTQGYGKYHGAIDIATKQGTPIVACDAGTVSFAGPSGGLGNAVQINHGDGFSTTYAHMLSVSVQPGQQVQKGEQIGLLGSTGHSTGPHCHLIVTFKGIVVNPMQYLP